MNRILPFLFVCLLTGHHVCGDDNIQWGQPVNGLRIGIEITATTVTSDQDLAFTVTAQNVSAQPITLPTPDTYLLKSGRDDDFHETPLLPLVTRSQILPGVTTMTTSSPVGPNVESLQPHVVTLAPGQSIAWADVPLGRGFYSPTMVQFNHQTQIEKSVLLPDSLYHIRFRFENDQASVANTSAWIGQADSGAVDLHVNAPSLGGIKVDGHFSLPKQTYSLDEPIEATFTATNEGETPIHFPTGGDYGATGRHDRFSIHAVDAWGWSVSDPTAWKQFFPTMGGGLGGVRKINPGESYTEQVPINAWCAFPGPGKYRITCERTLNISIFDDNDPNRYAIFAKPDSSLPAVHIETTLEVTIVESPLIQAAYLIAAFFLIGLGGWHIYFLHSLAYAHRQQGIFWIDSIFSGPVLAGLGVHCLTTATGVTLSGLMIVFVILVFMVISLRIAGWIGTKHRLRGGNTIA